LSEYTSEQTLEPTIILVGYQASIRVQMVLDKSLKAESLDLTLEPLGWLLEDEGGALEDVAAVDPSGVLTVSNWTQGQAPLRICNV